jgi:hypothetical protein
MSTYGVAERAIDFQTNNSMRWRILVSGETESGSDAGSNFYIQNWHDSNTIITNVVGISRATGVVTFSNSPIVPTATKADNSTNVATTAWVRTLGVELTSSFNVPAGADWYPDATHTGLLCLLQNVGHTVFLPGGTVGQGTFILSNISGGDITLNMPPASDFRATGLLHNNEKIILLHYSNYYRVVQYSPVWGA